MSKTPIPDFPGYYATKDGRIWSTKRNWKNKSFYLLSPRINRYGYLCVELYRNRKKNQQRVHSLILKTFVGPRPLKLGCRHKDSNKLNNKLSNLCWDTHAANMKDQLDLGIHPTQNQWGEDNPKSILTETEVKQIKYFYKNRLISQTQLGKIFGVAIQTINSIIKGRNWNYVQISI
jgi:DNA-binding XRE family transcriptional regulator